MNREEQIAMACGFQSVDAARAKMGADFDRFVDDDIVRDVPPQVASIVSRVKKAKWPLTIDVTAEVVEDRRLLSGAKEQDGKTNADSQ